VPISPNLNITNLFNLFTCSFVNRVAVIAMFPVTPYTGMIVKDSEMLIICKEDNALFVTELFLLHAAHVPQNLFQFKATLHIGKHETLEFG
jgi:hypothetical protein